MTLYKYKIPGIAIEISSNPQKKSDIKVTLKFLEI